VSRAYVERLALPPGRKRALLEIAARETEPARAVAKIHAALGDGSGSGARAVLESVRRRLELAEPAVEQDGAEAPALTTTPPLQRTPMAPVDRPAPLVVSLARRMAARLVGRAAPAHPARDVPDGADARRLRRAAAVRRTVFTVLALAQSVVCAYYMATRVLPYHGREPIELGILTLFTILFAWVSLGFWTAVSGFVLLALGRDRYAITRTAPPDAVIPPEARTAVVMPICNEHVARVFAGLRATYESVAATGALARFDFFVLSDSTDPDILTAERAAWVQLCAAVGGFGRVFYRWRRHRVKRKSGNIADFCRRWGRRYRYMVVLDADSLMSGPSLVTLVRLMEANPDTGIIQTAPRAAGRETLYARIQQFAARVYGPVFTAGLHFWQLGESYYWGHNAIIRVAPFMRHCALGHLPGRGPLSGEILSHDFVEAALMRRAGWKVWMAYDLPGSYEEMPPNLLDELTRDRRWCKGNLINARLFFWQGLHPAHRAIFMTGVMAYVSAPLWLASLALCTAFVALETIMGPQYFVAPRQLFPIWPEWDMNAAVGFAVGTAAVLFLPKILGVALVIGRGAARFGGALRVLASLLIEIVVSALLAPIRMVFHTQFVLTALTGLGLSWKSPPREDSETTWGDAARRHGVHTLAGAAWAVAVYWLAPWYAWWLSPVLGALVLSIPVSVYTSRVSLGRALRRARLFLIPEEATPPRELRATQAHVRRAPPAPGFIDAVIDPHVNAIACAVAAPRARRSAHAEARRKRAVAAALERGPAALTARQQRFFLEDPIALSQLHLAVWTFPTAHPGWRIAREAARATSGLAHAS
jgi:membrane glycosyltransferase